MKISTIQRNLTFPVGCLSAVILFSCAAQAADTPKYIFYMVGDGLGSAHRQITEYYKQEQNEDKAASLVINSLPVTGIITTHSANTLVTDSAAAGTALATGVKTHNGMLAMTPDGKTIKSLLEGAKDKGMATGVVTTTRLTHATPAAFIAKNESRNNENEIARAEAISGVDFLAGGGYRHFVTGEKSKRTDNLNLVNSFKEQGYITFVGEQTTATFRGYQPEGGDKVFAAFTASHLPYEIDRRKNDKTPSLAELTAKGIDLLEKDDDGFFMMIEGGRIDHASHANDVASVIYDTLAFDEAVKKAVDFYNNHSDETLIVVTGDHETGGLGLGIGKNYFINLDKVNEDFVSIEDKLQNVYNGDRKDFYQYIANTFQLNELTKDEKNIIERAMDIVDTREQVTKHQFGGYDPVAVAVAHVTSKRAGIYWTGFGHTASQLPISVLGNQADQFAGFRDNTDLANMLADVMDVKIGLQK